MTGTLLVLLGLAIALAIASGLRQARIARTLTRITERSEASSHREKAAADRERFGKELILALQSEDSLEGFGRVLLARLTPQIGARAGAFHRLDDQSGDYRLAARYASGASPAFTERYRPGEGVAGQAVLDSTRRVWTVSAPDWMRITASTVDIGAVSIVVAPIGTNGSVPAVLEFALPAQPTSGGLAALDEVMPIVSLSLEALLAKLRMREEFERFRAMETLQRGILSHVRDGIFGQDTEGRITFVNTAALGMLGFEESELIGEAMHPLTHHHYPDGRPYPGDDCPVRHCRTDGRVRTVLDEVFWRKDGTPLPVEYTVAPLIRDGVIEGTVISFRDVSEVLRTRREMEARDRSIAENEAKLRTIFETGTEGIWIIDTETRTTDLNPAMATILGRPREAVLGHTIFEFVDEENEAIFREQIRRRAQGATGAYEIALSRPDGSQTLCLFNASPLVDADGVRIGSFAMVADLTRHRRPRDADLSPDVDLRTASPLHQEPRP